MRLNPIIFSLIVFIGLSCLNAQETQLSPREQKILAEQQANNLPPLEDDGLGGGRRGDIPPELNIDSQEVVRPEKSIPNEGKPYILLSGGITPFQVGVGVLKYFIPELWGQADLAVFFFPRQPVSDYYLSITQESYNPFLGIKLQLGYSFYSIRNFEMSLFGTMQLAFINTVDIPIIFGAGFRLIYRFIILDVGVIYSLTAGGTPSPIFQGVYPIATLGFRF